jgi:hypothetical protein
MKDTVEAIMITLEIDSKQSLFVLIAADGTINRKGTGTVRNRERDMFIGISQEPIFDKLRDKILPEWFENLGGYDVPDKKGLPCELWIWMKHSDGNESALGFRYGSESQGPPSDVCEFVTEAVSLTESWYENQKKMVGKGGRGAKT